MASSRRTRRPSQTRGKKRGRNKQKTRDALLEAVLDLLAEGRSFSSLSLREVTRAAGVVPTAFYRHFEEMDDLGLGLVSEWSEALRTMMRQARNAPLPSDHLVRNSVDTFFEFVREHRLLFIFLVRERTGGSARVRDALENSIQLFCADLATDLARMPPLAHMATPDVQLLADLIVNTVFGALGLFINARTPEAEDTIARRVERQLHMIFLGARQWRSD